MVGFDSLKKMAKQFFQFGLVGVINTLVSFVVFKIFMIFNYFPKWYLVASGISYVAGAICSYILNKIWTFKSKETSRKESVVFFAVFLVCVGVQSFAMMFFIERFKMNETWAYIASTVFYTVLNFFGHKFITFRNVDRDASTV